MKYKILIILFTVMLFSVSCNSGSTLIGTWKVSNVKTRFDENTMTPEMLEQVVSLQKRTFFKIINDSVMAIISDNNTHEAIWSINDKKVITYHFKSSVVKPFILGKYENGKITAESKTPLGKITIVYEKK